MKQIVTLAALSCGLCWGDVAGDCVPSVLNVPAAKYPCVYSDHRAMFRVIAPDAGKVRVRIGAGFDMTKGPDNIWTVTTTPLVVGFHYYSLQVDGATVADPSTTTFLGSGCPEQRHRNPRARCRRGILPRKRCSSRPCERAIVLFKSHRPLAAGICLRTARLRIER